MKTDNVRRQPAGWFDEYRPGVEQKWFDFGRAEIWLGIKSELVCRNTGIIILCTVSLASEYRRRERHPVRQELLG